MGTNTRKVRLALKPLVEGTAMSRSAVSRVVKRLQNLFEAWRGRELSQESYVILILDAIRVPVRLAQRRQTVRHRRVQPAGRLSSTPTWPGPP